MLTTRTFHGCTTIDTDIIVAGGFTGRSYEKTVELLPLTGTNKSWQRLSGSLPDKRFWNTLVPVNNNKGVWLIGGQGGSSTSSDSEIWELKSLSSGWTTVA